MKRKNIKKYKIELAKKNIEILFKLLERKDLKDFHKEYVKKILKFCKSFNIRLNRNDKLKFCKKCYSINSFIIRFNPKTKTKNYICKECGYIKRFKYK